MKSEESAIMKPRRILCSLLGLLPWIPQIVKAEQIPTPFMSFPFDVSRVGSSLDKEFRIIEYRGYNFELRFEFAGNDDLYRVAKLVGTGATYPDGRYETPGVVVPVHLKIFRIDDSENLELLFDQIVDSQGMYGSGSAGKKFHGDFRRKVALIRLKPGRYRFQAITLKDIPEFAGTPSHFAIGSHPKSLPITE